MASEQAIRIAHETLLTGVANGAQLIDAAIHAAIHKGTIDALLAPSAIYAWVGEDEFGSGEVGIKQGLVPAGFIPLVSTIQDKLRKHGLPELLMEQSKMYGKTIRLVKYVPVEVVIELKP